MTQTVKLLSLNGKITLNKVNDLATENELKKLENELKKLKAFDSIYCVVKFILKMAHKSG